MSRNNWLSFTLPAETREKLNQIAQWLSDPAHLSLLCPAGAEPIGFSPMTKEDLHMTAMFYGPALWTLKKDELIKLNQSLSGAEEGKETAATMEFTQLELFPPGKCNLIVARFKGDSWLKQAVADLVDNNTAGQLEMVRALNSCFEPHVTLGKLRATKAQVASIRLSAIPSPTLGRFTTDSLYLCGTSPPQACLAWEGLPLKVSRAS